MTPAPATRPVLITLALILSGCSVADGESRSFGALADRVAAIDIPLDPHSAETGSPRSSDRQGLRPLRFSPAHVQVMSPHEMWDARDVLSSGAALVSTDADGDGLRDAVAQQAKHEIRSESQAAAEPARLTVIERRADHADTPTLRPAVLRPAQAGTRMIQLGAFSSPAGAQAAWARLKARADLSNLSPVFERVDVDGRSLTRLKVGPIPAGAAAALCVAAQVADPWCPRAG